MGSVIDPSSLNFPLLNGGDSTLIKNNNNNNNFFTLNSYVNNNSGMTSGAMNGTSAAGATLEQVEQVLQKLFQQTDTVIQNEANRWLLDLQNNSGIVPMCLELIKVNQPFFSQFFGIQTLYTKVHSDWEARWTDEFRITIKNTVFNRFLFDKDNNQVFNQKICSCISAIMIHSIPKLWENAVVDLLNLLHSPQSTDRIKKGTLDILTLLPIEFESVVLSNPRRILIKETFIANSENVIVSISEYLAKGLSQQLNVLLLKCVKHWIRFSNAKAVIKSGLLMNVFKVIENQDILVEGMSLIGDLINFHTYMSPLTTPVPVTNSLRIHSKDIACFETIMVPIIRKFMSLKNIYESAVQSDNLNICRTFAETLSQIVECYAPLMTDTTNSDIQQCLSFLLEFCLHHDREVSELTFNAWSYLGENVEDQEDLKKIYAKLLQILIERSSYPNDLSQSNDKLSQEDFEDMEDDIINYRNNVCDIIVTCFSIIGPDEFIQYIYDLLKKNCKTWRSYEVVIYVFNCVSINIIEDTEDDGISYQLTLDILSQTLTLPYHPKLTFTILLLLKDFRQFIFQYKLLPKSYNYILSIIQHNDTRDESLKLLYKYTEEYCDQLYENLEITLKTLETYYDSLTTSQQKLFIESILNLINQININQKPSFLQRLLNPIVSNIKNALVLDHTNPDNISMLVSKISLLESSLNFGEDSVPLFKEFINGIWVILEDIHKLSVQNRSIELSDSIWKIFWKIVHDLGTESMLNIDNIFNYLLSTMKAIPTITSKFYESLDLIINTFGKIPNFIAHIQNVVNNMITSYLPTIMENTSESMSTIERYFKCLETTLVIQPNIFYSSPYALNIMELSIRFLLNTEKESVESIINFYKQLFIKMNTHATLVTNYTKPILSNIFVAIVNDSTKTMTIKFSELLYDWILRYPESKGVIIECILNATWLPSETPLNERERLAKIIITLNNKAKFKALISDISQVCNNLMTWDIFISYEMK
ncbi:armadillo-like helical domain-containing protein [Tieghemostelium lacteum]|uniref:Armadillo-like helical domain-containing protein n=1 Tax=Tieghemostelium lacteum TaxID=361077 RepID=A0A151ZAB0_TIELA|nr:armadillo-like helical domain-containing protein [Tieghemostelium lacteum]|eukprot:KYQ90873.1 armadillo-like helical domain-containing protein [Tieghemostelium lacteum]